MNKLVQTFIVFIFSAMIAFGASQAHAQMTVGGVPLSSGSPGSCSCTVSGASYPCGEPFTTTTTFTQACPFNYGGTEIGTTLTPYICAGASNPLPNGSATTSLNSSTCLALTPVPTYGTCSTTCGTGTEPVASYYCADANGSQYPAGDCTAPAAKSCTDTSACCPANPANGSYSGLEPNCTLTCNAGYTAYNGSCLTSCPANTASTSYAGEPTCAATCNASYTMYNGSCLPTCPVNTASTSYSEPDCSPVCNAGYTLYNGSCLPTCPVNTVSTTYTEPSCAPVCNIGYTMYNGSCLPTCPVNTASTSYSEPDCSPVCNAGYTLYNGSCLPTCPVNTVSTTYTEPSCAPVCNTGYTLYNNACVPVCPANPASGSYGPAPQCSLTCNTGYTATNGQCVANPCPANPANGSYGVPPQCTLTCNTGYTLDSAGNCAAIINGACGNSLAQCASGSIVYIAPLTSNTGNDNTLTWGCVGANGGSYASCNYTCPTNELVSGNDSSGYMCVCPSGYTVDSTGQCVANPCPANPANGSYGAAPQCALTCNTGYTATNGQCIANPCPANPANGNYGAAPQCTLTCDTGYTASNGQCVANPVNGACGSACGTEDPNNPGTDGSQLCSAGTATPVTLSNNTWSWTCQGANGGSNAAGSAPQYYTATCEQGGLGGSGTIDYDNTNWVSAAGCCNPNGTSNQSYTLNGASGVPGCNAPCPANPANGNYGAAPQCTLTCDTGYTATNGQCVANVSYAVSVPVSCGAYTCGGGYHNYSDGASDHFCGVNETPGAGQVCSSGGTEVDVATAQGLCYQAGYNYPVLFVIEDDEGGGSTQFTHTYTGGLNNVSWVNPSTGIDHPYTVAQVWCSNTAPSTGLQYAILDSSGSAYACQGGNANGGNGCNNQDAEQPYTFPAGNVKIPQCAAGSYSYDGETDNLPTGSPTNLPAWSLGTSSTSSYPAHFQGVNVYWTCNASGTWTGAPLPGHWACNGITCNPICENGPCGAVPLTLTCYSSKVNCNQ